MKRIVTIVTTLAVVSVLSSNAFASETGAGCGVGKGVMEGKSGKDANLTASLINLAINFVVPHQLFGMTSGTLGCDVSQQVSNEHEKETFFAQNEDNITIEMAQGEGAHLQSFASVIGIENSDQDMFFSTLQNNYENIVSSDNVLASIDTTMMEHPTLSKYVE